MVAASRGLSGGKLAAPAVEGRTPPPPARWATSAEVEASTNPAAHWGKWLSSARLDSLLFGPPAGSDVGSIAVGSVLPCRIGLRRSRVQFHPGTQPSRRNGCIA